MTSAAAGARAHDDLLRAFARELELRDPDGSRTRTLADVDSLVEQAVARVLSTTSVWSDHLGPVHDVRGVQAVLGVTKQAVSKRRLLALTTGSGHVVYPAFQFTGSGVLPGIAELMSILPEDLVSPWTVASWLVSPALELDSARPIDLLADRVTAPVLALAAHWAHALSR